MCVPEGRGSVRARDLLRLTHKHTHCPPCVISEGGCPPFPTSVPSFIPSRLSVTCYLAFSGLGRAAPHEALVNDPQVLLPVVHFEVVDMRAARGTHGSHSIRGCRCPLKAEKIPRHRPGPGPYPGPNGVAPSALARPRFVVHQLLRPSRGYLDISSLRVPGRRGPRRASK